MRCHNTVIVSMFMKWCTCIAYTYTYKSHAHLCEDKAYFLHRSIPRDYNYSRAQIYTAHTWEFFPIAKKNDLFGMRHIKRNAKGAGCPGGWTMTAQMLAFHFLLFPMHIRHQILLVPNVETNKSRTSSRILSFLSISRLVPRLLGTRLVYKCVYYKYYVICLR